MPVSRGKWYFAHVVAALAVFILAEMILLNVTYMTTRTLPVLNAVEGVLMPLGLLAALGLWVWMLTDYFRNQPSEHMVWGCFLILANWGAAIVYFAVVWRPRQMQAMAQVRT